MESNRLRDRFRSLRDDFLDSLSGLDRPHKLGDIRALDNTLAMLETTIEVFPPLKAAIGGLRDVIRNTVISKQNLREYKQIASELQSHMDTLLGCVRRTNPTWMAHSIVKISRQVTPSLSNKMMLTDVSSAIEEETRSIKTQQGRSGTSRIANALGDEDRVLQSYRRVESLFRQLQIVYTQTSLLDKLLPASSAWYDAALSAEAYRGGCTPGTRRAIIKGFMDWANKVDTFKLYWMSGMPGTGKTTITYTLCHMLESTKQLGACFFCSRVSPDCRDGNRVFPTIAYQLAEFSNPYRNKVCEVLSATHNIAQRNINVQFENLILKPLISVKDALPADVIVVIDALDECSSGEQILSLLVKNASKLPIKFIVASRPEPNITQQMEKLWSIPVHQAVYLHEIEKSLVQADITIYLQQALEELDIPPDSQDIERLSAYAGNLFIIAATMVRYIRGHGPVISAYRCRQRLETTLAMVKSGTRDAEQDGTTDALYTSILEHVLEQGGLAKDEAAEIYQVLWATLCMREPVSIETLSKVLGMNSPIVTDAVNRLQSVLHLSRTNGAVSIFHVSFPDFMFSKERAGRFYCDKSVHDDLLSRSCFNLMHEQLRFNICNLNSSYHSDKSIETLQGRLDASVTSELFYACRFWADHLQEVPISKGVVDAVKRFLYEHLLFWIELVNLKGWVSNASGAVQQGINWLTYNTATYTNMGIEPNLADLQTAIRDAQNFVISFSASPVSQSTPHLYLSLLPASSKHSELLFHHRRRFHGLPGSVAAHALDSRGETGALAVWTVGYNVLRMAVSSDGTRLASSGYGGIIQVWDIRLGEVTFDLLGGHAQSEFVGSIEFSSNGAQLASGSSNGTICIWDVAGGGALISTIHEHTDQINRLFFSPINKLLASASNDGSICLWNLHEGEQPSLHLRFYGNDYWDISFSTDGLQLASGGSNCLIYIRSTKTGSLLVGPLAGHEAPIGCVRFSPNGSYLVSSAMDRTVRVWGTQDGTLLAGPFPVDASVYSSRFISLSLDPQGSSLAYSTTDAKIQIIGTRSGTLISGPFSGHTADVNSVHFLPNSTQLISGSADGTIRIWDTRHNHIGPAFMYQGHTRVIYSVSFSPDGAQVVSGSDDRSICLWDAVSGALIRQIPYAHEDDILSVRFSPDGAKIASASADKSIRIWNPHNGEIIGDPLTGHADAVADIAFSPGGSQLVSGSDDWTMRVWELHADEISSVSWIGHKDSIVSVSFSPYGVRVVSGSNDQNVGLWDVQKQALIWMGSKHTSGVNAVQFSPGGNLIASGADDGTIVLWDVSTGTVIGEALSGHTKSIVSLSFSPDGKHIASASLDHTIGLWDVDSRKLKSPPFEAHSGVYSVAFSPDGRYVISGLKDASIRKWDTTITIDSTDDEAPLWVCRKDGWVTDQNSRLLVWLPHDLRGRLFLDPRNVLTILDGQVIVPETCNTDEFYIGDKWQECYLEKAM
ncbi:hypothetical protein RhiTH_005452 [Rhizoctonia solani]